MNGRYEWEFELPPAYFFPLSLFSSSSVMPRENSEPSEASEEGSLLLSRFPSSHCVGSCPKLKLSVPCKSQLRGVSEAGPA